MEPEERFGRLEEYAERRESDIFEVRAYSGTIRVNNDWLEKTRKYPEIPRYLRVLVIPLPHDFDWTKTGIDTYKPHLPNSIVIEECKERLKRKGKKHIRVLPVLIKQPGRTSVKYVSWTGRVGERSVVWISEEKFLEITKRNLYVDKFYASQIFDRGKDSRNT